MVKHRDSFMFGKSLFYHWSHDKIVFVSIITLKCHDSNLNNFYLLLLWVRLQLVIRA